MSDRSREEAKDFFTLQWLLNPGKDEQRRARENEERATQMWMDAMGEAPTADQLYNHEAFIGGGQSQFAGLRRPDIDDGAARQAQLQALQQMQGIASAGGYTELERAQIAQAQRQSAQHEKSQRDAIIQQAQMRGMGGGGAQLAAQLQAQQSGANRAADQSTNIATQAQMRALQAMQGAGNIAQQQQGNAAARQGQLYGQSAQRAGAIDAFNQANTSRQQGVAGRNAVNRTAATQGAWDNRAGVLAGATGQFNQNSANSAALAAQRQAQAGSLLNTVLGAAT